MCSLTRLMHPQPPAMTDTPGKLNNLVNAVLLDLDQSASPNEELGPCSAFQFFPVGSRIEQALPQLLTKKPSILEHQRPRQSICCLIKGLTQQEEVSPLSLCGLLLSQAIKPFSEDAFITNTTNKSLILGTI